MPIFKGKNIRKNIGVLHKPDDVSRIPPKQSNAPPPNVIDGQIVAPIDQEDFYALQIARRVREVRQTLTANIPLNVDFDSISIGLELIVDPVTPTISVGIAFGGDLASVPANSNILANTAEVQSGEARFFDVKTSKISLVTTAATAAIRMTVLLP